MTLFQSLVMAILQGVTELFPVSSLGHAVIVRRILGWQSGDPLHDPFLPFLVILHLGTAAALLLFFWRDWIGVLLAVVGLGDPAERPAMRRLVVLLIVGTVPAAVAGFLLNHFIRGLFGLPSIAAAFLIVNGAVLWIGDRRHRLRGSGGESHGKPIEALTTGDALIIGVAQIAALIPGISRSGATIVTGLGRGLSSGAAAHFSFLLAAPIIGGAAILEIPKLLRAVRQGDVPADFLTNAVIGGVVAGIAAWLSVAFLTYYFRATEIKMMRPFALYCAVAGIAAFVWMRFA